MIIVPSAVSSQCRSLAQAVAAFALLTSIAIKLAHESNPATFAQMNYKDLFIIIAIIIAFIIFKIVIVAVVDLELETVEATLL